MKYLWLMTIILLMYCSTVFAGKPDLLHLHRRRLGQRLMWNGGQMTCISVQVCRMQYCTLSFYYVRCELVQLMMLWRWMLRISETEVLYPCSLLIQFPHRRQEYVALVTKEKELRKIHFITFGLLYFLLFSFLSPRQVIFVPRLLVPSCIWRDNDDYGDRVDDAEGVKWCHML